MLTIIFFHFVLFHQVICIFFKWKHQKGRTESSLISFKHNGVGTWITICYPVKALIIMIWRHFSPNPLSFTDLVQNGSHANIFFFPDIFNLLLTYSNPISDHLVSISVARHPLGYISRCFSLRKTCSLAWPCMSKPRHNISFRICTY